MASTQRPRVFGAGNANRKVRRVMRAGRVVETGPAAPRARLALVALALALAAPPRPARAQDRGEYSAALRGRAAKPFAGEATIASAPGGVIAILLSDTTRRASETTRREFRAHVGFGHRGSNMPALGAYQVLGGYWNDPPDPSRFAGDAFLGLDGDPYCVYFYFSAADSAAGRLVLESADSLGVRGRFEIKLYRCGLMPPSRRTEADAVWLTGRFRAAYYNDAARRVVLAGGPRAAAAADAAVAGDSGAGRPPTAPAERSSAQALLNLIGALSGRPEDVPRLAGGDTVTVVVGHGVVGHIDGARVRVPRSAPTSVSYLTPRPRRPLRYDFRADSGFKGLTVRGGPTLGRGGAELPDSGTLAGTPGPRYLLATADVVVHIQAENRRLYALVKEMYRAPDPLPVYARVVCERERMARQFGDTLAARLSSDVDYVLQGELPGYWDHFWRVQETVDRQQPAPPACGGRASPP